jgi:hypothetical protein
MSAPPAQQPAKQPSRRALLRKRKAAGEPVQVRRSSAELARLHELPLDQRGTEGNKKAVWNKDYRDHPRPTKKAAAVPGPPAAQPVMAITVQPGPAPAAVGAFSQQPASPLLPSTPPLSAATVPSGTLAVPATAARAQAVQLSPPPARAQPMMAITVVHSAVMPAAAAAAAATQYRSRLSKPRRSPGHVGAIRIGSPMPTPGRPRSPAATAAAAPAATAAAAPAAAAAGPSLDESELEEDSGYREADSDSEVEEISRPIWSWKDAEDERIRRILGQQTGKGTTYASRPNMVQRVIRNVALRMWSQAMQNQVHCRGWDGWHHHTGCPCPSKNQPFQPIHLLWKSIEFAHWPQHARKGKNELRIATRVKRASEATFREFLDTGRFLFSECHGIETSRAGQYNSSRGR